MHNLSIVLRLFSFQLLLVSAGAQSQQDPTLMNGGSILAMAGENCIAVAVDKRFGSGPQMVNIAPKTILAPHSRLLVGFTGLEGDIQSLTQELSMQISTKVGRHIGFGFGNPRNLDQDYDGRVEQQTAISPKSMSTLISHTLYGRRRSPYYVEPIVAGIEIIQEYEESHDGHIVKTKYVPYLCALDVIGAKSLSKSFVCSGAASKSMYGAAEAMWSPGLSPQQLSRVCAKAFVSALERDCLSGYGAIVYLIIAEEGIYEYDIACRND